MSHERTKLFAELSDAELSDAELTCHPHLLPAAEAASAQWGTGTEAPADLPPDAGPRTVVRTFAFVDLTASTRFLEEHGARATLEAVLEFRATVREVAARRGVRVAKWLGDGAMLVGVSPGPVIATAVEITARQSCSPLAARAGVSMSLALIFDGDDYLARGANFAARLCDEAPDGLVLCDSDCEAAVPDWVQVSAYAAVSVRGMGTHRVAELRLAPGITVP